jgi:hypothetical protein
MLEQCIDLLGQLHEQALQEMLVDALKNPPLEMPADHTGPEASQMFCLAVPASVRREFLRAISHASAAGLSTAATQQRGLGGFVEAWQEYAQYGS